MTHQDLSPDEQLDTCVREAVVATVLTDRHLLQIVNSSDFEIWRDANVAACEKLQTHEDPRVCEQARIWLLEMTSLCPANRIRRVLAAHFNGTASRCPTA